MPVEQRRVGAEPADVALAEAQAIDRLIDRSLVYRGHDPADRRVAVFLADRGAELLGRVEGGVTDHHRLIETAYGTERTERLMRDLEGLVGALEEEDRPARAGRTGP
ncbi:hypothetical protein [Streptosporangium sandarakinum]|uniref:hypothetical protein n=1 Tax=Streptosporangium sandarakinum TaxID=1260955 RepID=UPI0037232239